MASVGYRRGSWEVRYRDRSGAQKVDRFPGRETKRPPVEVLDRQLEVERDLRRGTFVGRDEREQTFGSYWARWIEARRISSARAYTDELRAKKYVLPQWEHWRLGDIRPSDVDDWIISLSKTQGPHSVRHCYTLFRGPLRRAIKDGIIGNPCIDVPLPRKPDRRKTWDDVLTAQEVDRLVAAVVQEDGRYAGCKTNDRYRALIFTGAWMGPRWNEAIGLRRCDLNPLRGEMAIGRMCVNQNGSKTYLKEGSKTGDYRTVPVPDAVMAALEEHLATYCRDGGRNDFLFLTRTGTHPLRHNFGRDAIAPAVVRAGIDKHVTWLTMRHTAASLMFDAGLTIFEVQQRLGHKSPTMTAEVYTHLMRERFEEGKQRLEEYMARQRATGGDAPPARRLAP